MLPSADTAPKTHNNNAQRWSCARGRQRPPPGTLTTLTRGACFPGVARDLGDSWPGVSELRSRRLATTRPASSSSDRLAQHQNPPLDGFACSVPCRGLLPCGAGDAQRARASVARRMTGADTGTGAGTHFRLGIAALLGAETDLLRRACVDAERGAVDRVLPKPPASFVVLQQRQPRPLLRAHLGRRRGRVTASLLGLRLLRLYVRRRGGWH